MSTDREEPMYELEYPAPDAHSASEKGLSLVVALQGYADAGQAVDAVGKHIKQALEHAPIATFNSDLLIDYRSRRPAMSIENSIVTESENTDLSLDVVRDSRGQAFLLLSGPEPDLRWDAFSTAVADLVDKYDVNQTICLYSAPMPVPHTRPLIVTKHGSFPSDPHQYPNFEGRITVPGSAALQLEIKLQDRGRETAGFTAHVPHYISASEYPEAVVKLLKAVEETASVSLPIQALEKDSEKVAEQLKEQVDESGEIAAVVHALEIQYDQEAARYRQSQEKSLLAPGQSVPSGDELGAEFERFLAEVGDEESPGASNSSDSDDPDGDSPANPDSE